MICKRCGLNKKETEFSIQNKNTGNRYKACDECKRKFSREYYKQTADVQKRKAGERTRERRLKVRSIVNELKTQPCNDCKISYPPYVMDFDHISPDKKNTISRLVKQGIPIFKIREEIAKCELVCSNCHRERTFKRGNWIGY